MRKAPRRGGSEEEEDNVQRKIEQTRQHIYISVSFPEHFVQQVAKLPADHGVAGQRQVPDVGPEGGGSTLLVCSQDDILTAAKEPHQQTNEKKEPTPLPFTKRCLRPQNRVRKATLSFEKRLAFIFFFFLQIS